MDILRLNNSKLRKIDCYKNLKFKTVNNCESLINKSIILGNEVTMLEDNCYIISDKENITIISKYKISIENFAYNFVSNNDTDTCIFNLSSRGIFEETNFKSIDVSNLDITGVYSMSSLFRHCEAKAIYNLDKLDVSNITYMDNAFSECNIGLIDISNWDIRNVRSTNAMFAKSHIGKLVMPNVNSESLETTSNMFDNFKSDNIVDLKYLKLKSDTDKNLKELYTDRMFRGSNAEFINLDVTSWIL